LGGGSILKKKIRGGGGGFFVEYAYRAYDVVYWKQ